MIFKRKDKKAAKKPRKAVGKQGASRLAAKGSKRRLPVSFNVEWFSVARVVLFVALFGAGVTFYGSFVAVKAVLDIPIEQVEIKGELSYQNRQQIAEVINQYVTNGFVSANLADLQKEMLALPWVYQVSIKRKLDKGLMISLQEQQPVAYWNQDALLNQYGEVFKPVTLPVISGLPVFGGKDHKRVLSVYKQLLIALPETQLPLRSLLIDERNVVSVSLVTETELVMSYANLSEQLERWRVISKAGLGKRLNEVKRADLRYSNGVAVSWNNRVAANMAATR